MNIIFIKGLRCETVLGVYDWERTHPRLVLVDLEVADGTSSAFLNDSIDGLMNYDSIAKRITELLLGLHYFTVERLAEHIAQTVLSDFAAPWVRVTVNKPGAVANAAMVGVTIERGVR